ncbi:MAG: hypothetical protein HZA89_14555 [Verrucomicrobia bacterium]|nr:hypothetical protein [Verrucomicrobiota bacterium]
MLAQAWTLSAPAADAPTYQDFDKPPHNYWQRPLKDPFSLLKPAMESGQIPLDRTSEKAFLVSLLKKLGIAPTSQMLLFSTTSLQLSLIKPENPRALFFNEHLYVGYIPRGRIEIVSLDPELGGIFYIFDIPRPGEPIRAERATRCMNCHAGEDSGYVPGLLVKSVLPGQRGGSLNAFRTGETGHQIPLEKRFGGWYLTGLPNFTSHLGNFIGQSSAGIITKIPVTPGERFDWARYPVATSDVLPQLLHEHQAGFVNRVVEAGYRARTVLAASKGKLALAQVKELDEQANKVVRYALFADEAPLPRGGVAGDAAFKADFLKSRRATPGGISLKDFDLQTRIFKHRCSYMIYSSIVQGLPAEMKQRVYQRLRAALDPQRPDKEYAYLPAAEKQAIHGILKATLKDW